MKSKTSKLAFYDRNKNGCLWESGRFDHKGAWELSGLRERFLYLDLLDTGVTWVYTVVKTH